MLSCVSQIVSVAARDSLLSRAQVQEIGAALPGILLEPTWIKTHGDCNLQISLKGMEKTDFFTREVDALVLQGICQAAIHSAKDLPDPLPAGLTLVALTKGVDPADALVFRDGESVGSLKAGAKVGTSSVRREETIYRLRPDLICVDIRGTIQQRLALLDEGIVDALVMAEAALLRLQISRNRMILPGITAPLQGRLAVIARVGDEKTASIFLSVDARTW